MNSVYVWSRIFPISRQVLASSAPTSSVYRMENICKWICRAHEEKHLSRNETANLMTRIRHDYHDHWEWWIFISKSQTYDEFKRNIPEYTCNRATFPSRDKEPLDPMCFPLSNEKLYGRGINSNVREFRDI